jgi:histidine ammonia-lyase
MTTLSSGVRALTDPVVVTTSGLRVEDVVRVARDHAPLLLSADVTDRVAEGRAVVERALRNDRLVYGLNTYLGHRRDERVPAEALVDYQEFIVATHVGGIGDPLPADDVRALLTARIAGLARGGSGISPEAVDALVALLNAGVHPWVPASGSVGASDLTHLAAVAEVLTGFGWVNAGGERAPGGQALARAGLEPYSMRPKDGIALISANATSIGLGALAVADAERVARLADHAGALTVEALSGNVSAFDAEVAAGKPFPGQVAVSAHMRSLLHGSRLQGPGTARHVQDPISVRTIPQVHGALRDQLAAVRNAVEIELNAVDDNPLVSADRDELLSNGNFSPMVLALSFESARLGLAHAGMLSERRVHKLLGARRPTVNTPLQAPVTEGVRGKRLPNLLVNAAASILAELKHTALPVTLNGSPLNFDVEDHAPLAPQAVALTRQAIARLETLLAIELVVAADTIDLEDGGRSLGAGTGRLYRRIRAIRDELVADGSPAMLVEAVAASLRDPAVPVVPALTPPAAAEEVPA